MRATHPLRLPTSCTLRRLSALATAVTLALTISSCSLREGTQSLAITSLNAQEADAAKPQDSISDMDNQPLSTASGLVTMSTSYVAGGTGSTAKEMATTVASRERSTDKFQWAVSIKPAVADQERTKYADNAQSAMSENMDRSSTGSAVVSPDGQYLSLILLPSEQQSGETAADLRTHIVVLDTKTGKTVRDVTVSGVILGQALTNSALAVETAQNYFPAGSGKGTITIFSLTDTSAQPSSFPTDKWLVGATRENLMLAPSLLPDDCFNECSIMTTVSLLNTDGSTAGSISGVTAVHPLVRQLRSNSSIPALRRQSTSREREPSNAAYQLAPDCSSSRRSPPGTARQSPSPPSGSAPPTTVTHTPRTSSSSRTTDAGRQPVSSLLPPHSSSHAYPKCCSTAAMSP